METNQLLEIVKRAQTGDETARQKLYEQSNKSVYFLALKILKNAADAEDITQDVFVTVFEKISGLKAPVTYYKWLHQIASNKCLNFLHKKRPLSADDQTIVDIMELEENDFSTPESLYDDTETRRIIVEIIDALPDVQRISIMYRYFNQFSIEEIAQMTNTNVFTVKNRLALARKKIRAAVLTTEEKEGIRLHGIVPIMPILMRALDEFQMPEGVSERIWSKVAEGAGIAAGTASTVSQSSGTGGEQFQHNQPKGDADMSNQYGNNNGPGQSGQNPQGNNSYQQGQQPYQQQGYQGQQPGQYQQGWQAPQHAPGTPPPASAMGAANMGATVAKAGMSLGAKIGIAAAAVVVLAGGAIFLPRLINSENNTPPAQGIVQATDGTTAPASTQAGAAATAGPSFSETAGLDDVEVIQRPPTSLPDGPHEATVMADGEAHTGTYEGEYDENGLFSGYGVWEYGRIRYEGYFENGVPNGHGILKANWNTNATHIYEGEFIDGVPNGSITHTLISKGTHTFVYDMAMGYAVGESSVDAGGTIIEHDPSVLICVEPWVVIPRYTISLDKSVYGKLEWIQATLSGISQAEMDNKEVYLSIHRSGAGIDDYYYGRRYPESENETLRAFSRDPGTYEVRLYRHDTSELLASATFTLQL